MQKYLSDIIIHLIIKIYIIYINAFHQINDYKKIYI